MKRKFRLTRTSDFKRVRRYGKSFAHPLLVLVILPNETEAMHFAVSAGRSVGNAVQRNHAKRWLREALRPLVPTVAPGWDAILIARKPITDSEFGQVQIALKYLLRKSHLLPKESHDG